MVVYAFRGSGWAMKGIFKIPSMCPLSFSLPMMKSFFGKTRNWKIMRAMPVKM